MTTSTSFFASSYSLSNTSYLTITNASNMYTNTSSSTYAQIDHKRAATTAYYVYVRGFKFPTIPKDSTINRAILSVKASVSGAAAATPALYNNTTSLSKNLDGAIGTSALTRTVDITSNYTTYAGYGKNFGVRFSLNRSSKNTASYLRIYGIQISLTYTEPVTKRTINITVECDNEISNLSGSIISGNKSSILGNWNTSYEVTDNTVPFNIEITSSSNNIELINISTFTINNVPKEFTLINSEHKYSYISSENVTSNLNIYIYLSYNAPSGIYIKQNDSWVQAKKLYKKENGAWVEITKEDIDVTKIYRPNYINSASKLKNFLNQFDLSEYRSVWLHVSWTWLEYGLLGSKTGTYATTGGNWISPEYLYDTDSEFRQALNDIGIRYTTSQEFVNIFIK